MKSSMQMKMILACTALMLTATASQAQVAHELQGEEPGWTEEQMRNAVPMEKNIDGSATSHPVPVDMIPPETGTPGVYEGSPGEPLSEGSGESGTSPPGTGGYMIPNANPQ